MHYYQFNVGDYRRDTTHLNRLEHSIYRDLIDLYYLNESPIPLETQWVMRRLRMVSEDEHSALINVLSDFFERRDDGFHQARIDSDIAKYHADCEKNRENGKKGGRPKSPKALPDKEENPVGFGSDAKAIPDQSQINPNQEPLTNNQVNPTSSSLRSEEVRPSGKRKLTFSAWLADIRAAGEKPITPYKPVWAAAEALGIPDDWIEMAWLRFADRYTNSPDNAKKRYTDWRRTFLNAVTDNWLGLWYFRDGMPHLTTAGIQADLLTREAA